MNNIFKVIKPFISKHQPEILMGMGISGMIFSTIWAIRATKIATRRLDIMKQDFNCDRKLTKTEIFKATWRLYLPVVLSTAISVPCIIAGNRVSNKRNMALAAAYTISETALQEYQEKTKELVGAKKEQEIHEAVSKDQVNKNYTGSQILITGDGDNLFFEPLSGRYFKSNWNKILKSANELNAKALGNVTGQITLTQWFNQLGLDMTDISDELGWNIENGTRGLIDIQIDSSLTPDNIPCGAIHYINRPTPIK
jgi:hypothetical protein